MQTPTAQRPRSCSGTARAARSRDVEVQKNRRARALTLQIAWLGNMIVLITQSSLRLPVRWFPTVIPVRRVDVINSPSFTLKQLGVHARHCFLETTAVVKGTEVGWLRHALQLAQCEQMRCPAESAEHVHRVDRCHFLDFFVD